MTTLFSFKNTVISIGSRSILTEINWDILQGVHTWIDGPNAAGKTTLCRAITGRCRIAKGEALPVNINYNDIRLVSFTDDGKLFHSINNVHYYQQRFNSWDADGHLTARDYLTAKGINISNHVHLEFIKNIGLLDLLDIERIKLSSGQTRKLLLASALLHQPKLIILDNPYIGLDANSRIILNQFLDELVENNDITLILSGQASSLPNCICHKIAINNGQLTYNDFLKKTHSPEKTKFQESLYNIKKEYNQTIIQNSVSPVLKLKKIKISYKEIVALKISEWIVAKGDRWALFGPNGSGKSTLVSLIYADHPQVYSQDIEIFGLRPGPGKSIWDIKKRIGFTSPELHVYFRTDLTAEEVVYTGLFDKFEIMGPVSDHSKMMCRTLFDYYNLTKQMGEKYAFLSTGHQRLCLLMRALIKSPDLLLMDEPFQGLDEENVSLSKSLINQTIREEQTLIFISHFDHEIPTCVHQFFNL